MPVVAPLLMSVLLTMQPGQSPQTPAQAAPMAVSPSTDDRPITRFFKYLDREFGVYRDFAHLPSQESAALMIVASSLTAAAHTQDVRMSDWSTARGDARYTVVGDVMGRRPIHFVAAGSLYVVGKAARKPQLAHISSDIIRAQAVSLSLTYGIKRAVGRLRPDREDNASFPSGHTSTAFTTATVLERHYGWKVGTVAYALAGFVGWSRVRDGRHWLSDVAMGSVIGIVSARAVTGKHTGRWLITPVKTTGGLAVVVTRRSDAAIR